MVDDLSLACVRVFATPWTAARQAFPVFNYLPELAQTHVHRVGEAIQPSHPLSSPSPPAFNLDHIIRNLRGISTSGHFPLCFIDPAIKTTSTMTSKQSPFLGQILPSESQLLIDG